MFKKLKSHRIRNNREFFGLDIKDIQKTIDGISYLMLNCDDLSQLDKIASEYLGEATKLNEVIIDKLFGLSLDVDKCANDSWIHDNSIEKYRNLIFSLETNCGSDEISHQTYIPAACHIDVLEHINKTIDLFQIIDLNLHPSIFEGYNQKHIIPRPLTEKELKFINDNKVYLRACFGDCMRIQGQFTHLHHYFRLMSRLLKSYYGVELKEESERKKQNQKRFYIYSYELIVPPDFFELLAYRIIKYRLETSKCLLPSKMLSQLRDKLFGQSELKWLNLWRKNATKETLLEELELHFN